MTTNRIFLLATLLAAPLFGACDSSKDELDKTKEQLNQVSSERDQAKNQLGSAQTQLTAAQTQAQEAAKKADESEKRLANHMASEHKNDVAQAAAGSPTAATKIEAAAKPAEKKINTGRSSVDQ